MLTITAEVRERGVRLTLEGELAGSWVKELERGWLAVVPRCGAGRVTVVLADTTFIDAEGKNLLAWMCGEGAELRAAGMASGAVVEEVKQRAGRPPGRNGFLPQ